MHRLLIAATPGFSLLSAAGVASDANARPMGPAPAANVPGAHALVTPVHYDRYYGHYAPPPRHWHHAPPRHHRHYDRGGYGWR